MHRPRERPRLALDHRDLGDKAPGATLGVEGAGFLTRPARGAFGLPRAQPGVRIPGARVSRPSCRGRAGPPRFNLRPPVQFSSVPFSLSVVSDSLRPQGLQHARPPCPSNSRPLSPRCYPTISSSVVPFSSRLQSFPSKLWFKKKPRGEAERAERVWLCARHPGFFPSSVQPLCGESHGVSYQFWARRYQGKIVPTMPPAGLLSPLLAAGARRAAHTWRWHVSLLKAALQGLCLALRDRSRGVRCGPRVREGHPESQTHFFRLSQKKKKKKAEPK